MIAPGARIDRYTVLAPLGRGGTAQVWKVRHDGLGTLHALKVLSVASADLRERLLREGRLQASLRHPNVVAVSDVVVVDGAPCLLLEYVSGPSLKRLLAHRQLSSAHADLVFRGIARGVGCAHKAGLVHRDLKPANVLLQPVDGGLVPKVTDFGLAKALAGSGDSLETRTGAVMGTPAYMAPEQIRDSSAVDARADVFALGAVGYELLTGVRAFEGEDAADTLQRVKEVRYRPIRELCPDALASMVEAVEAALVADPAARVPGVAELLRLWSRDTHEVHAGESLVLDALRLADLDGVEAVPIVVDSTWVDTASPPSDPTWPDLPEVPAALVQPGRPAAASPTRWAAYGLGGGLAFGLGALVVWLATPAPPVQVAPTVVAAPAPTAAELVAAMQADPATRAVSDLGMSMGDFSIRSSKGRSGLQWLTVELETEVQKIEAEAADVERRFPGTDAARAARYYAGLARFQAFSQLNSAWLPSGLDPTQTAEWNRAYEAEIAPAAGRSLALAKERLESLAAEQASSMYPRLARQLLDTIELVPPRK